MKKLRIQIINYDDGDDMNHNVILIYYYHHLFISITIQVFYLSNILNHLEI